MQSRYQKLLQEVKQSIKEVGVQDVVKLDNNSSLLIDVREESEWQKGHLPHALHVSRGILEGNIERIAPESDTPIVLYCGGGGRSALAAISLQQMGYENVSSMRGGFGQWIQEGLPVTTD